MSEPYDVVVVGAGVAGLYLGWSLRARAAPVPGGSSERPGVLLVEAGARTGGRIHTVAAPHAPDLHVELGAMRYWSSDELTVDLIDHLGMPSAPFTHEAGDSRDIYYLRGQRFTVEDLVAGRAIPYELAEGERGKTLWEIAFGGVAASLPEMVTTPPAERRALERTLRIGDRPITDVSMGEMFAEIASPAARDLLLDGLGFDYGRDPEVSAANFLQEAVDPLHDEMRTVTSGMGTLTADLEERYRSAGGEMLLEAPVHAVTSADDGLLAVALEGREPVRARHVVLAVPRRALELLDRTVAPLAGSAVDELLDSVVPIASGKLFMLFEYPWWRALGIRSGGSVTDLPLRRCVYFGTDESREPGVAQPVHRALLLADYSDSESFARWRELGFRHPAGSRHPGDDVLAPSAEMIGRARADLTEMHGVPVPEPAWSAFRDWTVDPYGAGYHYWRVGHASLDVVPRMRTPAPGVPLYVAGEAYSGHQGWINGALISAERVLRDHLGQPAPEWARPGLRLGP